MGILKDLFGTRSKKSKENKIRTNSPDSDSIFEEFRKLSLEQRCALLAFEFSVSSTFAQGIKEKQETLKIIEFERKKLDVSEDEFMAYAFKAGGGSQMMDSFIQKMKTITDKSILDQTLYMGFCIAQTCRNGEAYEYVGYVFEQVGYSEDDIKDTIKKIGLLGNMMNPK